MGRREVRDSEIKLRSANPDVSGGPSAGPGVERSLFKHSDFLKFWSADSISFFGSQFSLLAIPWVAVTTLGADASQMGILGALSLLAFPLFGLFVGVWVDRNLRKRTMIVSNLGRALLLATIPAATILGGLSMNLLYIVSFLVGTLQAFFDISYQAYVPSLVDRTQLVEANSKLETSRSTAQVAGPSIAGVLVQIFSAPYVILGDVLGYFGSATFLSTIRKKEATPKATGKTFLEDIKEGLAVVLRNRSLSSIAGCTATSNLFSNAYGVLLLLFFYNELHMTAFESGIVFTAGGVGSVVGALTSSRISRVLGVGWAIVSGALIFGVASLAFYFAAQPFAIPLMAIAQFIIGVTVVLYNVNQVSYRQALVPLELQGRMNASMRFIVWGTIPVGAILGGVLGQWLGVRPAIGVAAIGSTLAFLWVILSPVRKIRVIPGSEQRMR